MIEKLTPKQQAQMSKYCGKWLKIGLSCEPCNVKRAKYWVRRAYQQAGLEPPKQWIVCDSPLSAGIVYSAPSCPERRASVRASVGASVGASVRASVGASVRASVGDSVWDSVGAIVWDSVRASVWDSVWASVWDSVGAIVWDSVRASVWASVWDSVRDSVGASVYGAHDAAWLAFYDYFHRVCTIDIPKITPLCGVARHCGWWIPMQTACILQHRHAAVHWSGTRLHLDGGPAVRYRDGFAVWALNGVRVPQWLAETPSEQLEAATILTIDNAQVRAEFARKVGNERLWAHLDKRIVDARNGYALAYFKVEGREIGPYLKMENQSVPELWHIEGVPKECETIEHALNWRGTGDKDRSWKPEVLT